MFSALIKIIPLDLAATLSPGILALALLVLGDKNHARTHILSLFSGSLLVGIGVTLLGFVLGNSFNANLHPTVASAIIDLVLGIFFVIYGLRILFSRGKKVSLKEDTRLKVLKWVGIGIATTATNFDALFLIFTASKEVGDAEVNKLAKFVLLVINLFFFTLPITLPLFLKPVFPQKAKLILEKINEFALRYSRYIVFLMFLIFGIFLLYRGLHYF